jgi:hypothetical protein
MGTQQLLAMLIPLAVVGGYWWFKVGRVGGTEGYMRSKLGLQEGEQIAAMWTCYADLDASLARQLGLALVHLQVRGINLMLALTSASRLTIGDNTKSNAPIAFQRGQVMVREEPKGGVHGTLAGPHGLEPSVVMLLTPLTGDPLRLEIARSGFEAVAAWSRGA